MRKSDASPIPTKIIRLIMEKTKKHFNTIDLTGEIFGRLTVLSINDTRGNAGQIRWDCHCSCGNLHTVTGESLRTGKSQSCGCLLREARYAKNDNTDRVVALLKILYNSLKKRHSKRFKSQEVISFEQFSIMSFEECFYCGSRPQSKQEDIRYGKAGEKKKIPVTDTVIHINGIDRTDSRCGYITGNVVPCCKHCNTAKNSLGFEEFRSLIIAIYQNWAKK